jgi:lysophospholipase L1-like esterase
MTHRRRTAVALAVLMATSASVASCARTDSDDPPEFDTYVALGDSFTSGAGIPEVDTSNACQRSFDNYPRLVAAAIGAQLTDVSCGAANNDHVLDAQDTIDPPAPPQIQGVTKDTDLVSVSLGLNDIFFFFDIIITCPALALESADPTPCLDAEPTWAEGTLASRLPRIEQRLTRTLEVIGERAPDATLVVVGVPQIAPSEFSCEALPIAAGDYGLVRDAFEGLSRAMREAAESADAVFVDVAAASEGHDMCAGGAAWVNGRTPRADAPSYHPVPEAHRRIADLVVAALGP